MLSVLLAIKVTSIVSGSSKRSYPAFIPTGVLSGYTCACEKFMRFWPIGCTHLARSY